MAALTDGQLNALGRRVIQRNALDVVYTHPGGGALYVGSLTAAENVADLKAKGIVRVVNCMDEKHRYKNDGIDVMFFPISKMLGSLGGLGAKGGAVVNKFQGYFRYVDEAVQRGEHVLVHCLAGAHRAGTAGVAYLLYASAYSGAGGDALAVPQAIQLAKQRRPAIDPIGNFPRLLQLLDQGLKEMSG